MNVPILVDTALRAAGVPFVGVSFGSLTDRATWAVTFQSGATPAHVAAAATVLATVAIDAPAQAAQDQRDAQGQIDALPLWAKALALALLDEINALRVAGSLAPRPAGQALAAMRIKAGTL